MFRLAVRSIRYRAGSFVASLLTLTLGAIILMTFAALLDTSADADAQTAETLTIMASVVGGWGLVIVTFAAASTLTLQVRQRSTEMALLRTVGATPAQIRRLVLIESVTLALIAVLIALVPSRLTSHVLVDLLKDARQVPAELPAAFGPIAIGIGLGVTLASAVLAALLAARRATTARQRGRSRARLIAGAAVLVAGISSGTVVMVVFDGTEPAIMAFSGQGAILCAIGLALLSPPIITAIATLLSPLRGVRGYLTVLNLRGHTHQMATALAPIILFTGLATGTLYMQRIENESGTRMPAHVAPTIETLNYVVVGMVTLFAAVMLINTVVAATLYRRREFGQFRLAGSTRPQVLGMVGAEASVLAGTGVLFGTLAATATVIPYSVVKTNSVLPDTTITIYLAVVLTAAALTLVTSVVSARRATNRPAIETVRVD
ncbi:ABC transporter permease [Kibdelosporangium aridum]|uniref:ABC transporter permease n=2 Tax=Kibdelosporangium aridum TaxID=2030 RepID=A0A428Z1L2_KIBAR|nr:ABC transporter permease [Kibdelosporangium aridum]